ncbi:MAG: hypothetical protein KIS94_13985 [Chitinophagales bacterium]|nr:hypothetical protein [Chitinophagales bacterium]
MPELLTEELELFYRKVFAGDKKYFPKKTDYRLNGVDYADLKTAIGSGKNTFKNNISSAANQCEHAIISLPKVQSWT